MATEADTCRTLITPKLQAAGWDSEPHSIAEQRSFTDAGWRADRLKQQHVAFFKFFTLETCKILDNLLEQCVSNGKLQLVAVRKHLPDVLKVPPISKHGNVAEIAQIFGGFDKLGDAVNKLQSLLYVA